MSDPSSLTFSPVIDGTTYQAFLRWNVFGARYYVFVYDLQGNLIMCRALTESSDKVSCSLSWADNTVQANLSSNHGLPWGSVALITISDTGLAYDGHWLANVVNDTDLIYTLGTNPETDATGNFARNVDLLAGMYSTALIYRDGVLSTVTLGSMPVGQPTFPVDNVTTGTRYTGAIPGLAIPGYAIPGTS